MKMFLAMIALVVSLGTATAEDARLKAKRLGYAPAAPGWEWVANPSGPDGLGLHRVSDDAGKVATLGGSVSAPPVVDRAAEYANPYGPYYAPQPLCPNGRCPLQR